jgi:hypothetical protein
MIKIMLFLFILAFIPVLFASDPPNDPFFDIFNVEKRFALEPTSIIEARADILKAKVFFEKVFSREISKEKKFHKDLLLEFHRIYLNDFFPSFHIDFLITKIALSPVAEYLKSCNPKEWFDHINIVCGCSVKIRESISFLITPPEYESLLGFLGDAKEEQKLDIFDKIQNSIEAYTDWNDDCCANLASCSDIIKLKDILVNRARKNRDNSGSKWDAECALIFASLKSDIGGNLEEKEFEKVSNVFFCFLFYTILAKLPKKSLYELIFCRLLENGGIIVNPKEVDIEFLPKIDKCIAFYKNPLFITKVSFSDLVKSPELVKAGTTLVENAIMAYKRSIAKPSKIPSNPDSQPLQIVNPAESKPLQDANPPDTSPDRGKIIAAICLIAVFILAAIVAGLLLYRRHRNI